MAVFSLVFAIVAATGNTALDPARIERMAARTAEPEWLSGPARRDLAAIHTALVGRDLEAARARWRELVDRRGDLGARFDPEFFIDHLLARLAASRNAEVASAVRKLRFHDRQELAALEHVSAVDKQLSAYSGADNPQVPLREPKLAPYGDDVEPVTFPAGTTAGVRELEASLARFRERLPELSQAREAALAEWLRAIQGDVGLMDELIDAEKLLRNELPPAAP